MSKRAYVVFVRNKWSKTFTPRPNVHVVTKHDNLEKVHTTYVKPHTKRLCVGRVRTDHVEFSAKSADVMILLFHSDELTPGQTKKKPVTRAFAMLEYYPGLPEGPDPKLYITAVCAESGKGYGRDIMAAVEQFARENNIKSTSLSSLLNVVMFYRKQGYRFRHDCEQSESPKLQELAKDVEAMLQDKKDYEELLSEPKYLALLEAAIKDGFGSLIDANDTKRCRTIKQCYNYGIDMRNCFF